MSDAASPGGTPPSPADGTVVPGTTIAGYRVVQEIGKGGMGIVYAAFQPEIEKQVAIKVLKPNWAAVPEIAERFLAEARAVNRINNENIVDIFAFGHLPSGAPYFVMEFLEGETLSKRLTEGPIPRADFVAWFGQLCGALSAAHRAGIVHRDLKPDNIWLVADRGGRSRVKLLDFGIAKEMEAGNKLTVAGQVMGTPEYMAPEQGMGQAVDARVDIYALGVVLYEVFAGTVPFKGRSSQQIAMRHVMERPTAPSLHRPVPPALEGVILSCLEKEPAKRPPSIDELWQRLERALAQSPDVAAVPAVPDGTSVPDRPLPVTRPSRDDTGVGFDSTLAPISDLSRAPSSAPLSRRGVALAAVAALVAVSGGIGVYRAFHGQSNTPSREEKGAGTLARETPPARPTVGKPGAASDPVPSAAGLAASRGGVERTAGPDASASAQESHVAEPPATAPKTPEKMQDKTQEKKHKVRPATDDGDGLL